MLEDDKPKLNQKESVVFRRGPIPMQWFYMGDFIDAIFDHLKSIYRGGEVPESELIFYKDQAVWITDDAALRTFGHGVFESLVKHPELHNDLKAYWIDALQQLSVLKQAGLGRDFESFTDCQTEAQKLYSGMVTFWMPTLFGEYALYGSDKIISQELSKYIIDEHELSEAAKVLTAPTEMSFRQKIEIELLRADKISNFANSYHWLENGFNGVQTLDTTYFEQYKAQLNPQLEEIVQRQYDDIKSKKHAYIKAYSLPDYVVAMCELFAEFRVQQDKRNEQVSQLQVLKEQYLTRLSHFTDIDINELRKVSLRELSTYAVEDELTHTIRERFESPFGFRCTANEVKQITSDDLQQQWDNYAAPTVHAKMNTFSGISASRGLSFRTTAKVIVIKDKVDIDNFEEGDVIVTAMSDEKLVDIMRMAGAIITDEPGVVSHAGIMARELNIPCIVGTEIATKILETDDIVEVDTHTATVRKFIHS